jgi:hypothetical protein
MKVSEVTSLIVAKAKEAPEGYRNRSTAAAMSWAAIELWEAEFASWQAIAHSGLGALDSAAECAWQRRCAYADASSLLLEAW